MENRYPNLTRFNLDVIAQQMENEIRLELETKTWAHPGEFLTAYMDADPTFPISQFKTEPIRMPRLHRGRRRAAGGR